MARKGLFTAGGPAVETTARGYAVGDRVTYRAMAATVMAVYDNDAYRVRFDGSAAERTAPGLALARIETCAIGEG